jgi:hypothetical protein
VTIGVAVTGAGEAGRAHAAAHRVAPTSHTAVLPPLRSVPIADVSAGSGSVAAGRFGYERPDTSWQAVAADPEVDVVRVVLADALHRGRVVGLLRAGEHVLCEKPLNEARAFLEGVAGIDEVDASPRDPSCDEGLHDREALAAVVGSADRSGGSGDGAAQRERAPREAGVGR